MFLEDPKQERSVKRNPNFAQIQGDMSFTLTGP
jgi:hypothetical protein